MFAYTSAMASDNRDWYRDWWRKKTGYVERASFRVGQAEHQRVKFERKHAARSAAWRRNWLVVIALLVAFLLLAIFR